MAPPVAAVVGKKRKLYNLKNEEVASGGLAKPTLNPELNKKMRFLIIHLHELYSTIYGFTEADQTNIDESMKITSLIWTLYTLAKQGANNSGTVKEKAKDDKEVEINKKKFTIAYNKVHFAPLCKGYGLEFNNTAASKDARGTFQMQLCLIYAFRFRCNEGVYLNNLYKKGELGGLEKVIDVHAWGVQAHHLAFTYGANFPPSMQSALMQQLGPAALLIGLCETTSVEYQAKWVNAVVAQMSGVPEIASIANMLKGSRGDHSDLVTRVLNIAIFGVARQAHKASFPWAMLRKLHTKVPAFLAWTKGIKKETVDGVDHWTYGVFLEDETTSELAMGMDWSGKGMWHVYRSLEGEKFTMKMIEGASVDVYQQWLSYSVTGLWGEDTAVLKFMFDKEAIRRCNYGDAFVARRTKGVLKEVELLSVKYVCKLASAAQTRLGAVDKYIGIRNASVSGRCFSAITADDPRLALLEDTDKGIGFAQVSNNRIIDRLIDHQRKMLTTIRKEGGFTYGTTKWYKVGATSKKDCYGEESEEVVQLENKFIFTQD